METGENMTMRAIRILVLTFFINDGVSRELKTSLDKKSSLQLKVTDYSVKCSVVSRYAVTTVHSTVWNQLPVIKEAAFEVDLPSSAFISNFTITSNGKLYVAQVKERVAARKMYDDAKKQGKTAGLVATKEREIVKFRVAVSVPSGTRMSFLLTYEELLSRQRGRYELIVGLKPGQLVPNLTVDVSISERTGISFIKVLPLRTSRLLSDSPSGDEDAPASTHVEKSASCARVRFSPTLQQQKNVSSKGLNADLIIQYDVELKERMGDVQVHDGYFVHYFAPRGLPVVPKDVIFVIDISGSMIGNKIKQTKQAMITILGELREGDHFNIITFSDNVQTWKRGRTVRATRQNVREAQGFVRRTMAEGWTNINGALLSAAQLLNPSPSLGSPQRVPLVIFLTDGEATIGVTSEDTILGNAKKAMGPASLFCLAFGDDADFLLLKRLALENGGVARMVYEDADAALQLKGFYDEVANPLLSDVQLSYLDNQAFDVTRSLFPNYFLGSELIVVGRVKPGVQDLNVKVSATDLKREVKLENGVNVRQEKEDESSGSQDCVGALEGIHSFVHRLWAYMTIKELLLAKMNTSDPAAQRLLTDKATNLSLKYNFVTPFTSLVVVKPDVEDTTQAPTPEKPTTTVETTTTTVIPTTTTPSNPKDSKMTKLNTNSTHPSVRTQNVKKNATTVENIPPKKPKAAELTPRNGPAAPPKRNPSSVFRGGRPGSITNSNPKPVKPPPGAMKATTTSTTQLPQNATASTSSPIISLINDTEIRPSDSPPIPDRTARPHGYPTGGTVDVEVIKTDPHKPLQTETSTAPPKLEATVSFLDGKDNSLNKDTELRITTLAAATFAPVPEVTDGLVQWETAELLDVSSSLQFQRADLDPHFDYDYSPDYESWDETVGGSSLQPTTGQNFEFFASVDGDPHFVVHLPKLQQSLCFTVDGRSDDVIRLVEDPGRGIIVDGHLVGAPSKHGVESRSRTYFNQITVSSPGSRGEVLITVSLRAVVVEGEGRDILPVHQQGSVRREEVTVTVDNHQGCWIELARGVRFLVLFHYYTHPSYLQMAHLGFYITDGRGLSPSTQGLLGQFQHADIGITEVKASPDHHPVNVELTAERGTLRWGLEQIPVTLQDKVLKDSLQKRHLGKCWVVPKVEVERLLGHSYESYVLNRV